MLLVKCPDDYFHNEREYIYDVVLNDFLGLEHKVVFEKRDDLCITCDGKELLIDDTFFHTPEGEYFSPKSMPQEKMDCWDCQREEIAKLFTGVSIPVIYGRKLGNGDYIEIYPQKIRIGIDIFGSAFFMLTRYEELVREERDSMDRFSAYSSVAFKNNFLERPIINEYVELLKYALHKLWSGMVYKEKKFTTIPTHDVDRPSVVLNFRNNSLYYRKFLGDFLVRKNMPLVAKRLSILFDVLRNGYQNEWKYTYDFIMEQSEKVGLKSTFFFMAHQSSYKDDGDYYIDNPNIVAVMKHILMRGHNIGLHPEYNSYNNEILIHDNVCRLKKVFADNNFGYSSFGARQHYLRWSHDTWQYYENSGIKFDTTLSFADHIGFRCGVCYDYPVYDLRDRKRLKLREYPLIVMDATVLGYMGLSFIEAAERIINLKKICKKYSGNFVILWHNDTFLNSNMERLYGEILNG